MTLFCNLFMEWPSYICEQHKTVQIYVEVYSSNATVLGKAGLITLSRISKLGEVDN